ncbi:hypothetical protein SAMN03159341_14118 [Paenibacillus sp. 1_12]|nr:hypothetical protein SAMN03159341_14118 [Paenibacillus sp. 1_12]
MEPICKDIAILYLDSSEKMYLRKYVHTDTSRDSLTLKNNHLDDISDELDFLNFYQWASRNRYMLIALVCNKLTNKADFDAILDKLSKTGVKLYFADLIYYNNVPFELLLRRDQKSKRTMSYYCNTNQLGGFRLTSIS